MDIIFHSLTFLSSLEYLGKILTALGVLLLYIPGGPKCPVAVGRSGQKVSQPRPRAV